MSEAAPQNPVTVVTVCYNSAEVLPSMLASIPAGIPVILIDNASRDADRSAALAERYGARLIRNERNLGFGAACNQGAALADTAFILFLNPDTVLEPDTLSRLLAAAARYPEAAAMNPRFKTAEGGVAFKRRSHLRPRREAMPRGCPADDCRVSVLSGAALFVRSADFRAVGGFDPLIFLYHEDDDLSRRLTVECGPLMFVHDALVLHLEGRSSPDTSDIAAVKAWHKGRSRVYAARKHKQPLAFGRALVTAVLKVISPLSGFSRVKRSERLGYLRGIISTLSDGGAGFRVFR